MEYQRKWWVVLIEGLIAIAIGLYMLLDQASATASFGLLLAAFLAISGLVKSVKGGLRWNNPGGKTQTIQGLVGLIGGGGILLLHFLNVLSLVIGVTILGIALIVYGLVGLYENFFDRGGAPFAWAPVIVNIVLAGWGALIFFTRSQDINLTMWSGLILLLIGLVAAGYSFVLWKQNEKARASTA